MIVVLYVAVVAIKEDNERSWGSNSFKLFFKVMYVAAL